MAAASAQTKTNLEIINELISMSVSQVDSVIGGKRTFFLTVETSPGFEILKPNVYESFNKNGDTLKSSMDGTGKSVTLTIISSKVEYKNSYSDGIFGGTMLEREVSVNGSCLITGNDKIIRTMPFHRTYLDTIKLSDIAALENQSLPFTQSKLPPLPLLSNFWEPIIVVGTLIVTVILLFTVRSK